MSLNSAIASPPIIAAAAGAIDGKTYALAVGGGMGSATRLFGVSSDLMTWNEVADLDCPFYWGAASLVVTAAGTPIGIAAGTAPPGAPQPLSVMRFGTPSMVCAAPSAVDSFFALAPPARPPATTRLHVFGNHNATAAHWVLPVDP